TFVKLGQILSTRPDFVPEEFISELTKLQYGARTLDYEEVIGVIESEMRAPVSNYFKTVNRRALGAASIAQVHKARLKNGQVVVVKVQRPGIEDIVHVDLEIMAYIASLIEDHLEGWKLHRPVRVVEEFAKVMRQELDFRQEAGHIDRFAWQFESDQQVFVPKVYRDVSTSRLLTMDFVGGAKFSELVQQEEVEGGEELASQVTDLMMRQVFSHGFFHADPHPGNIHLLDDGRVCFLDYGMMGFLDERSREAFVDLVRAIGTRNERNVTSALLRMTDRDGESPKPGLEGEIADFMHQHLFRPLGQLDAGLMFSQLLSITTKYELRVSPSYFVMLKSLSLTESIVKKFHPNHDVIGQAGPILRKIRLRRMHPGRVSETLLEFGLEMGDLAREFPGEARRVINILKHGDAKITFRHDGLEPAVQAWDRVSNRLSFAVVLAALIIGSSLIIHAEIPPMWQGVPVIGLFGFVIAALMGFTLLIAIVRHGRM
ncbi:AarF/UbiB family protein, partial [bacterium]|nr:AarF/UbiB family protein [bacterium]